MKRIRRLVIFLLSFGLGRSALFISPILLANLLPSYDYGLVEWAYAAASLGGGIATMGVSGVIPLIVLRNIEKGTMAGIFAHHIVLVLACIVLVGSALWLSGGDTLLMVALLTAGLTLQWLWSINLKTNGKTEASMLLDGALFALMALTAAMATYFHAVDALHWVSWTVAGYILCLFYYTLVALFKRVQNGEAIAYQTTLTLGFPLMIATVVTTVMVASGRLVIGFFGGALLTADYAILARVAILPMVVHQIIIVSKFRHLFTLPDKEMERVMVYIVGMVVLAAIVFGLLFPVLGWVFGSVFVRTFDAYPLPTFWILAQTILWSAISHNDMVNTRQQTTSKILPWSISFLIISIPATLLLIQYIGISLAHFVYVHGLLMLLFYINQVHAMYRIGIRLVRVWILAISSYISLIMVITLLYR